MTYKVEHFGIMTPHAGKLAEWYQNVLGFKHLFTPPGVESPVFIKDENGYIIEFFPMPEGFRHPEDQIRKAQHLCLTVENYDEAVSDLESKGVVFKEDGFSIFQGGKVRFFQDPEGNWIHLVCRTKVPWS